MKTHDSTVLDGLRRQGELADAIFSASGIVLTQGGEPTFVPEETSAPEWNLEALGEEKLRLAWRLCGEIRRLLMPGAVIFRSNGKQYPGEPIPRWKLTLIRSSDGSPLWSDHGLLVQDGETHEVKRKAPTPKRFLSALAEELRVMGSIRPVYEDVEAAMRHAASCGDAAPLPRYSRARKGFVQPRWTAALRRQWQALHRVAGWILPLEWRDEGWISDDWGMPDRGDIILLPGSSPIGLRLPLQRLDPGAVSCAITAEIHEGVLTVFLPPLPGSDPFAFLLSAVEKVLRQLGSPAILLEGYLPVDDGELECLSVIPDPGVIEVNLPPATNWPDLEKTTAGLFEAAEAVGLKGTRRLPSGATVATGGGGHLVLGGPSMEQNPFLLKPRLLPSFLRFLQNHPVLSYLFSGRFVGPSSQAPRVDESFFEIPYELAIALDALEGMNAPADPAMVDAILRNLLLDFHGNTHRAEVSVDKFFNPFLPNGRLGLVEFRAIEMSPDAPMFLAVHALWRCLAAAFVTKPYSGPLIGWGDKLHEEWLLPSFLEGDLEQVLGYLSEAGFSFESAWFLPHFQFRFPVRSEITSHGFHWSFREAVEPWPLLGEQPTLSGSLVRCVDSSTARIEVRIFPDEGGDSAPPEVMVNGHPLSLKADQRGGYVGAVRFRSTLLPTCLHPQVAPHLPLHILVQESPAHPLASWHYHADPVEWEGAARHLIPAGKNDAGTMSRQKPSATRRVTLDLRRAG